MHTSPTTLNCFLGFRDNMVDDPTFRLQKAADLLTQESGYLAFLHDDLRPASPPIFRLNSRVTICYDQLTSCRVIKPAWVNEPPTGWSSHTLLSAPCVYTTTLCRSFCFLHVPCMQRRWTRGESKTTLCPPPRFVVFFAKRISDLSYERELVGANNQMQKRE